MAGVGITNEKVMNCSEVKKIPNNVSILRREEANLVNFTITVMQFPLYSGDVSYMINDSTGYIKLSKFARTTYNEFLEAVAN